MTILPPYKSLAAFILLATFIAQVFSKSFIVVDYYANTGKYAVNCENKAKPQMHCKGKCQMMKKLQQEEKKDSENPERKVEKNNEVLTNAGFYQSSTPVPVITEMPSVKFIRGSLGRAIDRTTGIFHPPRA